MFSRKLQAPVSTLPSLSPLTTVPSAASSLGNEHFPLVLTFTSHPPRLSVRPAALFKPTCGGVFAFFFLLSWSKAQPPLTVSITAVPIVLLSSVSSGRSRRPTLPFFRFFGKQIPGSPQLCFLSCFFGSASAGSAEVVVDLYRKRPLAGLTRALFGPSDHLTSQPQLLLT